MTEKPDQTQPTPEQAQEQLEQALFEIRRIIAGQDAMLERVRLFLLAQGHLLIEGVPGLAKTLTIKTTAGVLGGSFARVQFTPDLVPPTSSAHASTDSRRAPSTPSSARCSATSSSPTRSIAHPRRCNPRSSRSCRSGK